MIWKFLSVFIRTNVSGTQVVDGPGPGVEVENYMQAHTIAVET
jgi:hypothetical protein